MSLEIVQHLKFCFSFDFVRINIGSRRDVFYELQRTWILFQQRPVLQLNDHLSFQFPKRETEDVIELEMNLAEI